MCIAHTQIEYYDIPEKTVIFKGLHFPGLAESNKPGTLLKPFSTPTMLRIRVSTLWHPGAF